MAEQRGKFWGSESSSEASADSSESEAAPVAVAAARPVGRRWADESSSDEEVTRRVVRNRTDKSYEALEKQLRELRNHMKVDDFAKIVATYEAVLKLLSKNRNVEIDGAPTVFIKAITDLEEYCTQIHSEKRTKSMSENKARAFNTLKAKVRKGNKEYEESIKHCQAHPESYEDGAGGDGEESAESEQGKDSEPSASAHNSDDNDSSSSDSDSDSNSHSSSSGSWAEESSDSSESESEDEDDPAKRVFKWLIDSDAEGEPKERKEKKTKEPKERRRRDRAEASHKGTTEEIHDEMTADEVRTKLTEVMQLRGKRAGDREHMITTVKQLARVARNHGATSQLSVLAHLISAEFDNTSGPSQCMAQPLWLDTMAQVETVCDLLRGANYNLAEIPQQAKGEVVSVEPLPSLACNGTDNTTAAVIRFDGIATDPEATTAAAANAAASASATATAGARDTVGSSLAQARLASFQGLTSFVEKLDDESMKALQFADVHAPEYQERLGSVSKLVALLYKVYMFLSTQTAPYCHAETAKVALRLLEQLYYRPVDVCERLFELLNKQQPLAEFKVVEDTSTLMERLAASVYKWAVVDNRDVRARSRACLCQAYHYALQMRFCEARDVLQLSGVADVVMNYNMVNVDLSTQILFNRALVMTGICAFKHGKIEEAHQCLMELAGQGKAKELLAQGLVLKQDKTPEQEKAERRRQLPYHMHISLDVVESAHYICAMLLEVPFMAKNYLDARRRALSKTFRRHLEAYDKHAFTGPPENPREAVLHAAKALQRGDWQSCLASLDKLRLWEALDGGEALKPILTERVQVEALRTYIFTYASMYESFSVAKLVDMFKLDDKTVRAVVSKMMVNDDFQATWDEATQCVVVHKVEPSKLQHLALQLADKAAITAEGNERILDARTGGGGGGYGGYKGGREFPGDRWDGGRRRAGIAGPPIFGKGKGKGKGKGGMGAGNLTGGGGAGGGMAARARGWEHARAGASQTGIVKGGKPASRQPWRGRSAMGGF